MRLTFTTRLPRAWMPKVEREPCTPLRVHAARCEGSPKAIGRAAPLPRWIDGLLGQKALRRGSGRTRRPTKCGGKYRAARPGELLYSRTSRGTIQAHLSRSNSDVPEPSAMALLGFAGLGYAGYRSRHAKVDALA
jgi:hypothetical protein